MREILFRGKAAEDEEFFNIKKGQWLYGSLVIDEFTDSVFIEDLSKEDIECINVVPETVGQKTCVKDRKDHDIYEGDILKHTLELDGEIMEQNYLVKFVDGAFRLFQSLDQPWSIDILNEETIEGENIVVIGNIHDNHELMEV